MAIWRWVNNQRGTGTIANHTSFSMTYIHNLQNAMSGVKSVTEILLELITFHGCERNTMMRQQRNPLHSFNTCPLKQGCNAHSPLVARHGQPFLRGATGYHNVG
jgi:hypothetical protein